MGIVFLTPLPVAPTVIAGSVSGAAGSAAAMRTDLSETTGIQVNDNASFVMDIQWDETKVMPLPFLPSLPLSQLGLRAVGVRASIRMTSMTFESNEYAILLWNFQTGQWEEIWTATLPKVIFTPPVRIDKIAWASGDPSRFFDSQGRFRIRFANAKALGRPPSSDSGVYLACMHVLADCERVVASYPRQRLNPIPGYTAATIEPSNGIAYKEESFPVAGFMLPRAGAVASLTGAGAIGYEIYDFPIAVPSDLAVLEFYHDVGSTTATGTTSVMFSRDGGASWTDVRTFSGPIASAQHLIERVTFTPPSSPSDVRLRVTVTANGTPGRSHNLTKPIVYYRLPSHRTVRLFLRADPVVQGGIAAGDYTKTHDYDSSTLLACRSYVKGTDIPLQPRYAMLIDFQTFDPLPAPPSQIAQIYIYAHLWNPGVSAALVLANGDGAEFSSNPWGNIWPGQTMGTSPTNAPFSLSLLHLSPGDFLSGGALRLKIKTPDAVPLNQLPSSQWTTHIDFLFADVVIPAADVVIPAPEKTDWPFSVDVGERIIASRMANYPDPRPAFLRSEPISIAAGQETIVPLNRPTGRSFLLTDVYLWASGPPSSCRVSILRNGSDLPPFKDVILQPVIERDGVMSEIFANLNVLFDPSETAAIRILNTGTATITARLYVVGFTWFWINELAGWHFHDLSQPV
jgi:hypothetical protein